MKQFFFLCSFLSMSCFAVAQPCIAPTVTVLERDVCQDENINFTFTGIAPFYLDYSFNGTRQTIRVAGMTHTRKATKEGKNILIVHGVTDGRGCSYTEDKDGVEIGGLIYAKYNVDAPGTFVRNPEDAGMLYQWNSTVGWSSSNPLVSTDGSEWNSDWDGNNAATWEDANNICPEGWRIPTMAELERLYSYHLCLRNGYDYGETINGKHGHIWGEGNNAIFLPDCRFRYDESGTGVFPGVNQYYQTNYWSKNRNMGFFYVQSDGVQNDIIKVNTASAVRCVKSIIKEPERTYTITVHPKKGRSETVTICSGESYLFNGKYYNTTGEYTAALKNSFGCDSTVTLKLKVNSEYNIQENIEICDNKLPFTFRDTTFKVGTQSGKFVFKRKTKHGCDSTVTLNLTVNEAFYVADSIAIREHELPFTFRGITFDEETQSGEYVFNSPTAQGCDSIIALKLKVYESIYLPAAFSPTNAAASVREFRPVSYDLEYLHFWIYDKWGNLLWYSDELQEGIFTGAWNGTYDGRLMKSDVYSWKIEAKFLNGVVWRGQRSSFGGYSKFGSVMLIR